MIKYAKSYRYRSDMFHSSFHSYSARKTPMCPSCVERISHRILRSNDQHDQSRHRHLEDSFNQISVYHRKKARQELPHQDPDLQAPSLCRFAALARPISVDLSIIRCNVSSQRADAVRARLRLARTNLTRRCEGAVPLCHNEISVSLVDRWYKNVPRRR
jgi:hypothetical protein